MLEEHEQTQVEVTKAHQDSLAAVTEVVRGAENAARSAQASSWAAQKDATRATRAVVRILDPDKAAELENWTDAGNGSAAESSAWDQLSLPTNDVASDEESFWSRVPEHLGDGSLLEDDEGWIDKLKRRLPGKDVEGESEPEATQT
jgi:hypothetical protein